MTSNISSVADARHGVPTPTRRTVDAFTRTLHALLALSFVGAYVTAESEIFRWVHVSLGYTLGGLLLARVVWGVLGPRHARFSALWGKLRGLVNWFQGLRAGQASWSQAQNLYMAVSVALLLLVIAPVVVSGYVTYQEWTGDWMEEVHEFFGNFMLMAVLAHIGGVLALSLLRRRNLATPMFTGRVPGVGPDLVKRNHAVLAAVLLTAVLSFWVWQWQSGSPLQTSGGAGGSHSVSGKAQSEEDDD